MLSHKDLQSAYMIVVTLASSKEVQSHDHPKRNLRLVGASLRGSLFLQNFTCRCRHHSTIFRGILALEIIRHLFKSDPFDSFMLVDVINDSMEM